MVFDGLIQQVLERVQHATAARAEAERAHRAQREENDHYVTGGVNWDGFSLEHLIKMVAEQASPQQLDALAGEWRRHGSSINQASTDLQRSVDKLMQFWSGASADDASRTVTTNAAWITELGTTAQDMAGPIEHAGGALRSAQDTMPGKPHSSWLASAGGGAAAGFAVGGPVGAAFGAAIGGIASAFGFGSSKKKLKRKAVQTMQRYEGALLGIDQTTPQFGSAAGGTDPGGDRLRNPGPGVGTPNPGPTPPGATGPIRTPGGAVTPPRGFDWGTTPSLADGGPAARWQGLTGVGPGGLGPGEFGSGPAARGPGFGGLPGGPFPGGRGGLAPGGRGLAGAGGRGVGAGGRGPGARGGYGAGGLGAGGRGMGQDSEHRGRGARAGRAGSGAAGERLGAGGRGGIGEEAERRAARGRFGRGGLDPHGGNGYGGMGGAGSRKEEDDEHHRRFPVEEDPFSSDLKAAPPVIGL